MKENWKPEIDMTLKYNPSTGKYDVVFSDYVKPDGKKFVINNNLLYEIISGKIKCDYYFGCYGYIENMLFKFLDNDWPDDSDHWLYLCEVVAYKEKT